MQRPSYPFLGLFAFTIVLTSCATTQSEPAEVHALRESQERMAEYKSALASLDQNHVQKQIDNYEYSTQRDKLNALIQQETGFQTAIINGDPQVPDIAKDLLRNIGNFAAYAAGARPTIVVGNLKSLSRGSGSTLSH